MNCNGKAHKLITIMETPERADGSQYKTKWCTECGGVVVDFECDGRIYTTIMPMRFPAILSEKTA